GEILGSYYLKPNFEGPGSHICNCGYVVAAHARGKGVATSMCEHSLKEAARRGFRAMQFNIVVSTNETAVRLWRNMGFDIFRSEEILGSYYLKPNFEGPGSHICNCGYVVAAHARGKGVATSMCEHSLKEAARRGFRAMQFNIVVSTNETAVRLWRNMGFDII